MNNEIREGVIYGYEFKQSGVAFKLHRLGSVDNGEVAELFAPQQRPSDYHEHMLRVLGDSMRPDGSQYYWSDGRFMWYTDATQTTVEGIYQTANGILIFVHGGYLYRVMFQY